MIYTVVGAWGIREVRDRSDTPDWPHRVVRVVALYCGILSKCSNKCTIVKQWALLERDSCGGEFYTEK